MSMIAKDMEVEWIYRRVVKEIKIARTDSNSETRAYYKHNHVLVYFDEKHTGLVRVTIDVDALVADMARKAARNSSGRATTRSGMIKARRISNTVLTAKQVHVEIPQGYSEVLPEEVKP
jgi:hypothetical protein